MPEFHPTRRTVLRTAGLVALAGGSAATLGACSSAAGTATPAESPAAPESATAPTPSAAPSTEVSPSLEAPSPKTPSPKTRSPKLKAPSGPSVATAKVPVGGGVILPDANYVITQPAKGSYKAFSKICTHQGCPVAEIANGTIDCRCHGSKFSIQDGSVVNPPARKPLAESKVTVFGSKVYVTG